MDPTLLRDGITLYLILVASLSVHEWAHAWMANRLGDPTARMQGRVTLNPIAHMDMVGTVILPLLMIFLPLPIGLIGWGKPVPVDRRYFRRPVRDDILVSMVGPASNIAIALATVLVGGMILRFVAPELAGLFGRILLLNCVLAIFNCIPIPPLDGSHVMRHLVGMSEATYMNLARWGFVILIVLINTPAFKLVIIPVLYATLWFGGLLAEVGQVPVSDVLPMFFRSP